MLIVTFIYYYAKWFYAECRSAKKDAVSVKEVINLVQEPEGDLLDIWMSIVYISEPN